MEHTYFFRPPHWSAAGTYYDENGTAFPLAGKVQVRRDEDGWTLGGYLEVAFPKPVRFTNDYIIRETGRAGTLAWESVNPALGTLRGTFEIVGECIVSSYVSDDGIFSGTETLRQLDESTYENVGVSFQGRKRMSAWTALIKATP